MRYDYKDNSKIRLAHCILFLESLCSHLLVDKLKLINDDDTDAKFSGNIISNDKFGEIE